MGVDGSTSTNKETTIFTSVFEFCRVRVVHALFPVCKPLIILSVKYMYLYYDQSSVTYRIYHTIHVLINTHHTYMQQNDEFLWKCEKIKTVEDNRGSTSSDAIATRKRNRDRIPPQRLGFKN